MRSTLLLHVLAGAVSLVAGYVALYAAKGAPLHRRSGMVFVVAMLTMCAAGTTIAAVRSIAPAINVPAGLLTAYLVVTALTAVRPLPAGGRPLAIALMLLALTVGATCLSLGVVAVANGGSYAGMPAFPYFLFGVTGLLGGALDVKVLRRGALQGAPRLARHLWRMSFALVIASMSFFLGQSDELPQAMRIPALLAVPPLAALLTMFYWLWRVRGRRRIAAPLAVGAVPAAVAARGRRAS